jgi:hypothetical protein
MAALDGWPPARVRAGAQNPAYRLARPPPDLRANLWAETSAGLEERLASIAQHLAEVAAEHADQKERQALRQASREARPSGPESEAAGARALADLAAGPGALTEVRRWLRPEHFALPEQGEVYAAMRDMQAAGKPVDRITVAREARRRGVDTSLDDFGFGAQAPMTARAVQRHAVLSRVRQAGQDISAEATDPTSSPRSILRTADERLREVERERDVIRQHEPQLSDRFEREAGHETASYTRAHPSTSAESRNPAVHHQATGADDQIPEAAQW